MHRAMRRSPARITGISPRCCRAMTNDRRVVSTVPGHRSPRGRGSPGTPSGTSSSTAGLRPRPDAAGRRRGRGVGARDALQPRARRPEESADAPLRAVMAPVLRGSHRADQFAKVRPAPIVMHSRPCWGPERRASGHVRSQPFTRGVERLALRRSAPRARPRRNAGSTQVAKPTLTATHTAIASSSAG